MYKLICLGCNSDFEKDRKQYKYCSQKCYNKNRIYITSEATKDKLRIVNKYCKPPSHKGKTYQEIYGDNCKNEVEKRRQAHLKLWDIKGRKIYKRPKHSGSENNNWRKSVFERDNYTCQECGIRSSKGNPVVLNAHHIKSFIEYPELRLDLTNGLTLCIDCHKKTDNYGYKIYNNKKNACGSYFTDKTLIKE